MRLPERIVKPKVIACCYKASMSSMFNHGNIKKAHTSFYSYKITINCDP